MARYQREIEEILQQVNKNAGAQSSSSQASGTQRAQPSRRLRRLTFSVSPGRLFMVGVALLLTAILAGSTIPGFKAPMVWVAVSLFIIAYILFFARPRQPFQERRWRGRSIEDDPPQSPLERLRDWLRRR